MALKKNRTTVGIISIILGATLCFVIAPIYNKTLQKTVEIVQVTSDIQKGQKIKPNQIKIIETTHKGLPTSALLTKKDVEGKYAVVDMVKDDTVLEKKLSENLAEEDNYLYRLDGTEQAISFTIQNFASGLSGKLQTGDIISVISTGEDDNTEESVTFTPKELQYVRVLAVTDSVGKDKEGHEKRGQEEEELPVTITVLANKEQAELIANLEETSKMHVSLMFRGTDAQAQKYIEQQNKIVLQN